MTDARRFAALPTPFAMHRGGSLPQGSIAYETWGTLNVARDNALLLFTGLSPSAHAASSAEDPSEGWWEDMVGPGKALDTNHWFVVCINSLGSCFGSSGPASHKPGSQQNWRLEFPELSIEDIARAGYQTLQVLDIARPAVIAGASLGGMVVLAFVALYPGCARRLVSISGTAAASPSAIALRSVQREAILRDPAWNGGNYAADQPPRVGMSLARKLGTITYRSPLEWNERFGRSPLTPATPEQAAAATPLAAGFAREFAIEGYLEAQALKFASGFDANCYLYLSRAMDRFDLGQHGPLEAVFRRAGLLDALIVGVETDMLFPIGEQSRLADALREADVPTTFRPLQCREGHDAFLVDVATFAAVISPFLLTP